MALTVSATDTEVQKPVNVVYQQTLLRNARVLAPYFIGTNKGELSEGSGTSTIKWRRFNTSKDNASGIAPTTTALSEITGTAAYGMGRSSDTVHFTDVTATLAKYGQFFILNEEVDVFNPNGTMMGITRSLAISAGRSLNQLQRNIVEDNATQIFAGGAASEGAVTSKITAGAIESAINTLMTNEAMPFMPMSTGSTNVGTGPVLPGLWGITHPDVAYDIAKIAGFKDVATYSGQVDTVPGEFGTLGIAGFTVRFVQSSDSTVLADGGGTKGSTGLRGTSDVDTYNTVIYGQDALGSVGLGQAHTDGIYRAGDPQGAIQMIAKGRGTNAPSATEDPFDEITTLAWKAWHAGALLNGNWARNIVSGATSITT